MKKREVKKRRINDGKKEVERRDKRGKSRKRKEIVCHASTCPKMSQSITLKARGKKKGMSL